MADRWRSSAAVGAVAGAALLLALGVVVHGRRALHVDSVVLHWLHPRVTGTAARVTLDIGTPVISLVLLAAVLVVALRRHRPRLAVVAVVAPAVSSGLTEYVLKPWVGRPYGTGARTQVIVSLAYPSGHETLVASTAFVVLLAVLGLAGSRGWQALCVVVLAAWVLASGVGLVVNFWHYATDVLGAIGLSAAVVLGSALLADLVSSPGVRGRPRTTHAA